MPRPCKRRRICALPDCKQFGPLHPARGGSVPIAMTIDEFETIRLIDLEGLTQEQCAARMDVARATVQAIYGSARVKLAQCLVGARPLEISGGDYELCAQSGPNGCPHHYAGEQLKTFIQSHNFKEEPIMTIAVTYENGQIFQHFGHTAQFKVYTVREGKIESSRVADTLGSGHGALAGFLSALGVDTLICGGIGGGARTALAQAGIRLLPGASGNADAAVQALLDGTLAYDPNTLCNHHHEGGDHDCGSHTCGNHSCEH